MSHLVTVSIIAAAAFAAILAWLYRHFPIIAIHRSKTDLEQAFDSFDDPLAVIDIRYRILRANRAYASLVGRAYSAILGSLCYTVLRGRSSPCEDCRMPQAQQTCSRQVVEHSPHPTRGDNAAIALTFFPFEQVSGSAKDTILEHIRDITDLERLRDRLRTRNQQYERIAHNLRTAQRAVQDEINMAREVHECILPKSVPSLDSLRVDVTYRPVESVGGDLYDFVPFPSGRLGVFIGDASGHGLPAAFVSTMAKMAFYHHTREEFPPDQLLYRMNRELIENVRTSHYLTCFWGIYDPKTRQLSFSRGGHPKPIVVRDDGELVELDAPGTLVGLLGDATYSCETFACRPNDRFFLFTDGVYVTKKEDGAGQPALSPEELRGIIAEQAKAPFEAILPGIQRRLGEYVCEDDYTLLVMEVMG